FGLCWLRVEKPKAFPSTAWQVNELKRLSIIFGFGGKNIHVCFRLSFEKMKPMTSPPVEAADLLYLKLLPAWVKEPVEPKRYADVAGEHGPKRPARHRRGAPTHRGSRSTLDSGR